MSGPSDLTTAYMVGLSDGKDTIKAELARKDALLTAALKRGKELAQANHQLLEAIREYMTALDDYEHGEPQGGREALRVRTERIEVAEASLRRLAGEAQS